MRISFLLLSILPLITLLSPYSSTAQQPCGTDVLHQEWMKNDAAYKQRILDKERILQKYIQSGQLSSRFSGNDTIPVVVHVLHTGEAVGSGYNISDAQIQSAIDRLNAVFADYDGGGSDTNIRFALAVRDQNGCGNSTGINRVDASGVQDYENVGIATDANRVDLFNLSRWNTEEYLNFWVVSEINDNNGNDGTQGFATFSNTSHQYDGVVCMYNTVGYDPSGTNGYNLKSSSNQNEVVIHEFGHYLDLYHTFQGDDTNNDGSADSCPADAVCGDSGDCCADTDPHQRTYSNVCWTGVNNTCTGSNYGNVVRNYMAYSSQDCKDRFTDDQVARMQATLQTSRTGLLTSPGLTAVSVTEPTSACDATTSSTGTSGNFGIGITKITIGSWTTESGNSYEDGGYVDNWCNHIDLAPNTTYSYSITTSGNYDEYVGAWIDYDNDGSFTNGSEMIITPSTFGSSFSGTFTTPSSMVYNTPLRLRVRSSALSSSTDACLDPTYGQAEDYSVYFEATANLVASVSSLSGLHTLGCCASDAQTFTLSGDGLSNDVSLSLSESAYELSSDGTNYSNTLTYSNNGGDIQNEPVTAYVRLKAGETVGDYPGNLTISSSPATDVVIALSGEVAETEGIRGNSLSLDGSGDYALADSYEGITGSASRTYEAWIKTSSSSGAILANGVNSTGEKWIVRLDGGKIRVETAGAYRRGPTLVNDNNWHHIAITLDNSGGANLNNLSIYVDGWEESIDGSSNLSSSINTATGQNLWIATDHSNRYFTGEIDEVRVWSVALTEAEIRQNMHLTLNGQETGLEAYYQFNEASGSAASEKIHGYHLGLNGNAGFSASTVGVSNGSCATVSVGGSGDASVEINSNGLAIDFTDGGTAPNGDLMIFLLNDTPANSNGANYEAAQHWIVRNFGSNQSGLNIESVRLTVAISDPIMTYDETTMSLYKRDSGSDGSWTVVGAAAETTDPASGEIFFSSLTSFSSFSQLSIGNTGLALPVTWDSFLARRANISTINLEWSTSSEIDCQEFIVEQSDDGRSFKAIGTTECQGSLNSSAHYHFRVEEFQAAYYRLKQVDLDQTFEYSEIRFVDGQEQLTGLRVFPNPTSSHISLTIESEALAPDETLSLELTDLSGRTTLKMWGTLDVLNQRLNEKIAQLPKGVFLLQIQAGNAQFSQRILLQ